MVERRSIVTLEVAGSSPAKPAKLIIKDMSDISLSLSREDAVVLIKCLKVAKARKNLEARHDMKKGGVDFANKKFAFITKIEQVQGYLEHLNK